MARRQFSGIRGLKSSVVPSNQDVNVGNVTPIRTQNIIPSGGELDFSEGQSVLQALTERTTRALAQFGVEGFRLPQTQSPFLTSGGQAFTSETPIGGFAGVRTEQQVGGGIRDILPVRPPQAGTLPGPLIAPPPPLPGSPGTLGKFKLPSIKDVATTVSTGGLNLLVEDSDKVLEEVKDIQTTISTGGLDIVTESITGEPIEETLADTEDFFTEDVPEAFQDLLSALGLGDTGIPKAQATAIAARDLARQQQEIAGRFERARTEIDIKRQRTQLARKRRLDIAQARQGAQAVGAAGGTSEIGAISAIRGTETAEQGFLTTARTAAIGAGTARDVATSFANQATDIQTAISQEQADIANTRALLQGGLQFFTQAAGAF